MQPRIAEGKRAKGLKIEPKNEMKKLRELAKASFCGDSTGEGASTSYAFRLHSHSPATSVDITLKLPLPNSEDSVINDKAME